jgi:hypothetical protein
MPTKKLIKSFMADEKKANKEYKHLGMKYKDKKFFEFAHDEQRHYNYWKLLNKKRFS